MPSHPGWLRIGGLEWSRQDRSLRDSPRGPGARHMGRAEHTEMYVHGCVHWYRWEEGHVQAVTRADTSLQ